MRRFDPRRGAYEPLCSFATVFELVANETIFGKLGDSTSQQQFDAAQQSLLMLRQELEARLDTFHFPASTGTHRCVTDCFVAAAFRLKNLALLQPAPPPPLAPRQQPLTPEEVVNNLEQALQTSPKETFLGRNDHTSTNENDR